MKIINAAGTAIIRDGKLIALKLKNSGGYGFPCGKVDPGETFEAAAIRETAEETGYNVSLTGPYFEEVDENNQRKCLTRIYLATAISKGERLHTHEGDVEEIPLEEIVNSKYRKFNENFLTWYKKLMDI